MTKRIHRRNVRFKNHVAKNDKKKILGVAMDTSKTFHKVIIFNFFGELIVDSFSINTLKTGYEELKRKIKIAQQKINAKSTYIALETPAKYTANLVYHLRRDFKSVVFVPPYEVSQNRKQRTFHGLKTDDIDAGAVGDLLIRGEFTYVNVEKKKHIELKNLINFREQKIILRTALKNQIEHRFSKIFPGINCDLNGNKKLFSHSWESYIHLGLLNYGKTPRQILMENEDDLIAKFKYERNRNGRRYIGLLKERIKCMLLPDERTAMIDLKFLKADMEIFNYYNALIAKVEKDIVRLGEQTDAKCLFSQIKGLTPLILSMYVGLIGDFKNFRTAGCIYSYSGLAPMRKQSGRMDLKKIGIKRMGNPLLRGLLFRMATQVILHEPFFRDYFERLKKDKSKSWKERRIIICRKLNSILFALIRDKAPFKNKAVGNSSDRISYKLADVG